jgi:predicted permease
MARGFANDLRSAFRQVRRAPGFSAVIVVTIALGVGANTALFNLLDAVLLRPLSVQNPDRLVAASVWDRRGQRVLIPLDTIATIASRQHAFDAVCAYTGGGLILTEANGVEELTTVEVITAPYFSILGARPILGRLMTADDIPKSGEPAHVVVLGSGYWQRRFGGDRSVIGRTLRVDGFPLEIIGVTSPDFRGLRVESAPDVTFPLLLMRQLDDPPNPTRPVRAYYVVGRLAAGVTLERAQAELSALWSAVRDGAIPPAASAETRAAIRAQQLRVEPLSTGFSDLRPRYGAALRVLFGLTGLLLLIACVNLSGLVLARLASREQELTVRVALGASRSQLVRQLFVEGLVLTGIGTIAAVPLAWWSSVAIGKTVWTGFTPMALRLTPDARMLALATAVAGATAITIGLLPAWTTFRRHAKTDRQHARTVTHRTHWWGKTLLVAQVALSLVLLFGAGLLSKSLSRLQSVDLGFRASGVAFGRVSGLPGGYTSFDAPTYYAELYHRLAALHGVSSVSFSRAFPAPVVMPETIGRADRPGGPDDVAGALDAVSPRFFETVGMTLLRGRDFDWHDNAGSPAVAIVNQTLARRLVGTEDALGQRIRTGTEASRQSIEIVGIVSDARFGDPRTNPVPMVFRPSFQEMSLLRAPIVEVRSTAEPAAVAEAIRGTLKSMGREYTSGVLGLDEQVNQSMLRERVMARLSTYFAGLAVLLAAIGVYGLLAYAFTRRTREIGVRIALGASRPAVLRMVLRDGLVLVLLGIVIGAPCAVLSARLLTSVLFNLSPMDPVTLAGSAAFFILLGAFAALAPAARAAHVDPLVALRAE